AAALPSAQDARRPGGFQLRMTHEVGINRAGRFAPITNGPHHQALPALRVTRGEDSRNARLKVLVHVDVTSVRQLYAELIEQPLAFRVNESHREQYQICGNVELAVRDLFKSPVLELYLAAHQLLDDAVLSDDALGRHAEITRSTFLMRS